MIGKILAVTLLAAQANSYTPSMRTYKVRMKGGEEQTVRATGYWIHREGFFESGKVLYVTFYGNAGMLQGDVDYIVEVT